MLAFRQLKTPGMHENLLLIIMTTVTKFSYQHFSVIPFYDNWGGGQRPLAGLALPFHHYILSLYTDIFILII
jgi:hypothetical protein